MPEEVKEPLGLKPNGQPYKVLIVDDLLATGGTVKATIKMIEELGGVVVGAAFLIELVDLEGRKHLEGINVHTILKY